MHVLIITYNLETVEFWEEIFIADCCDRRFIHQWKPIGCGDFATTMYLGCLWLSRMT